MLSRGEADMDAWLLRTVRTLLILQDRDGRKEPRACRSTVVKSLKKLD
jgi:hypothetical protein